MEIVKDSPVEQTPPQAVTALQALESVWPAVVAQVEGALKAGAFKSLDEMHKIMVALDAIRGGAKTLLTHPAFKVEAPKPADG
jgi:hypothetical protein